MEKDVFEVFNRKEMRMGQGINPKGVAVVILLIFGGMVLLSAVTVVPAGHVGVVDLFGVVSSKALTAGPHLVIPLSRVHKMSIQTKEEKETAAVPSKEGLIMGLEVSLWFKVDSGKAPELYKTVGLGYEEVIVRPLLRSALRGVTAAHEAKDLYTSARDEIANLVFVEMEKAAFEKGISIEKVLLRDVRPPETVARAIEAKLKAEQEAEQMKFVLQKERQEADRKRVEAAGVRDFQQIIAQGLSPSLLAWKGIEATEKLANSQNSKIVVIGNTKSGLPLIFSGKE